MKSYILISVAIIAAVAIGIASAQLNNNNRMMGINQQGNEMMSAMNGNMMQGMGMMNGMNMMSGMNDSDNIEWMRSHMKDHMNFTDEEFDEMAEHCPMMGASRS